MRNSASDVSALSFFRRLGIPLFFFLLGFSIYASTLRGGFYFDDRSAIIENRAIRDITDLRAIWGAFNTRCVGGVTFALNYAFGKLNPFGYRLFNVLLHIFASLLIYPLVFLTLKTPAMKRSPLIKHSRFFSLSASLLFLVHPIQTQAVNFIWQRVALLAALFYLASIVLYACARLTSRIGAYFGALVTAGLGMFCKETAVTIPFMILLYEFSFFGPLKKEFQKRLLFIFPFLVTLVVIPLTLHAASDQVAMKIMSPASVKVSFRERLSQMTHGYPSGGYSRRVYLLTQANVLRTYLRLLFLPVRQNLDYDYPVARGVTEPRTLFSITLLLAIFLLAVLFFQNHRLLAFSIFWFFLTLSLESVVILGDVIFEHRLYLPMAGFTLFLPAALSALFRDTKKWIVVCSAILLVFSFVAHRRNTVWKDEIALWEDTVQKSPGKARPHNNLGVAYGRIGRYDKEIEQCLQAIRLNPTDPHAYNNAGFAYGQEGRTNEEIVQYLKAVAVDPEYAQGYYNLGVAYGKKGDYDTAITYFKKTLLIHPTHADAYNNLGVAYGKKGEGDKEISCYFKALQIDPENAYAYNNLGVAYGEKGDSTEGAAFFKKALKINPGYAEARANLEKIHPVRNFISNGVQKRK